MRPLLFLLLLFPFFAPGQIDLSGIVHDRDDLPVEGAYLILPPHEGEQTSDEDGRFLFEGVEAGNYTLICDDGIRRREIALSLTRDTSIRVAMVRQIMIEEVVVSSVRAGKDNPMTFRDFDKGEIEALDQAQDVPYALRWSPSAVVTSDAGTGIGYTGVRIRGSDPTRINVTINGIPLNDAESQGVYWVDLPDILSSATDIQVQRGVGTSTNGAGAFGASVNVNTNQFYPDAYLRLEGLAGSFESYKGSINFGTGLLGDRFTIDGRLSYIGSDGYIDRATADLKSYYLSAAYLDTDQSFRFNLFSGKEITYQAWNGVPGDSLENRDSRTYNSAGTEKPGAPYDNEVDDYRQTHLQAFYNRGLGDEVQLGLAAHYTLGEGFFEQYKAGQHLGQYFSPDLIPPNDSISNLVRRRWLDNDFYGLIGTLQWFPGSRRQWEVTASGGYSIYKGRHFGDVIWTEEPVDIPDGHTYYDNDARKHDWNGYTKAIYRLSDRLTAYGDLQLRGVRYSFRGIDENGRPADITVRHLFFNPKAGIRWQPIDGHLLTASFGIGAKEPNRDDYVESSPLSRPKAERLYNAEAGYSLPIGQSGRVHLNGYYMYYRDQLVLTGEINDVGAYTRTNVPKSYRLGLEAGAETDLYPGIRIRGSFTISRNKILDFTEYVDRYDSDFNYLGQEAIDRGDSDLAFSPSFQGNLQLTAALWDGDKHGLSTNIRAKYVGEQYIGNSSDPDNTLEPYHFLDLELRFRWSHGLLKEVNFYAGIRNLYDHLYESNAWSYRYRYDGDIYVDRGYYPQAGQSYYLRVAVDFW